MRKYVIAVAFGLGVALSTAGCAAWWQTFLNDPVQGVQSFEQVVNVSVAGAQLAWPAIMTTIPAASQATANQQFNLAVAAVNHAEAALNDAVNAAVAAKQSPVDFTSFMQAVSDAVAQIIAIVDQYKTPSTATAVVKVDGGTVDGGAKAAPVIPGYDDMKASYSQLAHFGVKLK